MFNRKTHTMSADTKNNAFPLSSNPPPMPRSPCQGFPPKEVVEAIKALNGTIEAFGNIDPSAPVIGEAHNKIKELIKLL